MSAAPSGQFARMSLSSIFIKYSIGRPPWPPLSTHQTSLQYGQSGHPCLCIKHHYNMGSHLPSRLTHPSKHTLHVPLLTLSSSADLFCSCCVPARGLNTAELSPPSVSQITSFFISQHKNKYKYTHILIRPALSTWTCYTQSVRHETFELNFGRLL